MTSSQTDGLRTVDPSLETLPLRRYDLVLAAIPLAFVASLFADALLAVPTPQALAVAGVLGGLAVADALFVNPPT